jgi:succinate dehydrogenase / fumarate reductase membrane anchor subunit
MGMRTTLGCVRGLGSSNDGIKRWLSLRLTGLALVPLTLWFVFSTIGIIGADLVTFKAWVGLHGNPVLLILLTITMFHHAVYGVQEIIEDYIQNETVKVGSLIITKFTAVFFAASCILAVLRLTFGG